MLEAHDLHKSYGEIQALNGFSLTVQPGEIVGLVGHNGAGKTTFVEIVTALVEPDSGRILVDGGPPRRARAEIGVTPQHLGLYPSITVREHLHLYGRLSGLRRGGLAAVVDELSAALHLDEILDRRTGVLSGGQQRRVQAATALVHRPRLLLLDEPTAGADLPTRQAILDVVRQRAADGAAVVYTTHYLPELVELRATLAVARRGRVIARGTYDDLVVGLPGEVRLSFDDEGDDVAVSTTTPTRTLISMLSATDRGVSSVEVRHPSLDDLYRSLAVDDVSPSHA